VTRDESTLARLREVRSHLGLSASPDAALSLLKGLKSLDLRMKRSTETARVLAARLEEHPAVLVVRYPGFGGLISFDVAGDPVPVETATRLILNQTSLGGVTSSMESRHRWEGDRIPVGLLRLSVGLEDADALWADLEQALNHA
jgi:cystathionine gamma-synthase